MKKKNNIDNYVKLFESLNLENLNKFDDLLDSSSSSDDESDDESDNKLYNRKSKCKKN